jgi:hypothetical protein
MLCDEEAFACFEERGLVINQFLEFFVRLKVHNSLGRNVNTITSESFLVNSVGTRAANFHC